MTTPGVMQAAALHDFHVQVYGHAGVPPDDARLAAAVRLESVLRQPEGFNTFAVARLRNTVQRLQDGGINATPQLTRVREQPHCAVLDGDNGLGAVVGTRAMALCLEKARQHGGALVGVRNSTTLGAMACYAMQALEHDAIGFASTNTELKIGLPPWGGVTPALGNNPFAVAIPGGSGPAIVLDMSVIATRPQGSSQAPESWRGRPFGREFLARAIIGDHKGYGLALILEVLAGVLTGAGFGQDHAPERLDAPGALPNLGHLFGVLHPSLFIPLDEFMARIDRLRSEMTRAERAPGVERIVVPGELEYERRSLRLQHGIPLDADTMTALHQLAAELGIENLPLAIP
jgi:LDH2 family malate/lactate/ureidoglycolate dehydrogenase